MLYPNKTRRPSPRAAAPSAAYPNRCRGAHSAAVGGSAAYGCGVPLAGTVCPPSPRCGGPLHTVYRSIPIDEGRRAEVVAPYGTWFVKTDVGAHSVRPASSNMAAPTERAYNVRYNRYHQPRRPLPHTDQRNTPQVPEASRSEAGRAAAAAHSKSKDGGTLSRHLLLSESHRRRVQSTSPTKPARPARKPRPWGS